MQNLKEKLFDLLESDTRIWNEEKTELNETLLKDMIDKLDEKLLEILLSSEDIKEKFFIKVTRTEQSRSQDVYVLKQNELKFFIDENKLDNSYTQYRNKIGLRVGNKLLSERDEVVLDWPFKDCVLEGGMTKEDQKRNEIFFNEVLAKDEIDRLYEPKALVNWKRYTAKGEEKVTEIKRDKDGMIRENLIIKGNNLLALHTLKKEFAGKVKLIYIDPPYNTENGSFRYNDCFNHSSWLVFMRNRLEIAKQLLSDDGLIFVQIDDNEQAYLKVLMDELFDRENFINSIIWKRTFSHGDSGQGANHLGRLHDVILLYKKSDQGKLNNVYTEYSEEYVKNFYKYTDENGRRYRLVTMTAPGGSNKGNPFYEVMGVERYWMYSKKNMEELIKKGEVVQTNRGTVPQRKRYLDESKGVPLQDLWVDINPLQGVQKEKVDFVGQKPEKLLERIIELSTNQSDLVIDFHIGTGTTLAVAHKMGRQYIGIEQMDYIHDLAESRLKEVIKGDQSGISKNVNWQGGGDFIYLELAKWNEEAKEKILNAKSLDELVKLFDELYERYFLNYNVKTKEFKEKIVKEDEFKKLSLDEQKKLFVEMLDMNQMYVNFSERNDKKYGLSADDIKISEMFYSK